MAVSDMTLLFSGVRRRVAIFIGNLPRTESKAILLTQACQWKNCLFLSFVYFMSFCEIGFGRENIKISQGFWRKELRVPE